MRDGSEFDAKAREWDEAGKIERARQATDAIAAAIPDARRYPVFLATARRP